MSLLRAVYLPGEEEGEEEEEGKEEEEEEEEEEEKNGEKEGGERGSEVCGSDPYMCSLPLACTHSRWALIWPEGVCVASEQVSKETLTSLLSLTRTQKSLDCLMKHWVVSW